MDTAESVPCPRFPSTSLSAQIEAKIRELVDLILAEASDRSNKELIKHAAILHNEVQQLREENVALKQEKAGES